MRQEAGREKLFVCKCHCWAFSLDGALNHIPDEHEFIAVDKSERGLKPVRCELFGNWKITMDAFQEVYHLKHIHPNTVDASIDHRGASMALFPQGSSRMTVPAKTGETRFSAMPPVADFEADDRHEMVRSGSLSYNMFPNIVTPIGAYEFPYLQFWPRSYQERRIHHFHEYVDQVIGVENIPEPLRVAPRLGALREDGRGRRAA